MMKPQEALQWREGVAESPVTDEKLKSKAAQCPYCHSLNFVIFLIEGHDHEHLQCMGCGTSFCFKGKCL
jgi:hypothetical protein